MKAFFYALVILSSGFALTATAKTHCLDSEYVYFSCGIDGSTKVASLCGEVNEFKPSWIQYRFGAIESPELIYPKAINNSLQQFSGFFEYHKAIPFQLEEVWFRIGNYRYRIKSLLSEMPDGEPMCSEEKPCITNTLSVTGNKHSTELQCTANVINNLQQLQGHISDDQTDR